MALLFAVCVPNSLAFVDQLKSLSARCLGLVSVDDDAAGHGRVRDTWAGGEMGAVDDESFARAALTREGVMECVVLDDCVALRWPALVDSLQTRKPNVIWITHDATDLDAMAARRGAQVMCACACVCPAAAAVRVVDS